MQQLFNAEETASRLGISMARLYELVRAELIPVVRIGRQLRFDPKALAEWVASGGAEVRCVRESARSRRKGGRE